jgi:hypothetical protein
MKTTRDIKSGLDLARNQKVPCRTSFIEEKLKKELKDEFGDVLSEDERAEIEEKESRRIEAHNLALKKSRMKVLKQKERGKLIQEVRMEKKSDPVGRVNKNKKPSEKKRFNEISFEY